jgi:hypothetical protein
MLPTFQLVVGSQVPASRQQSGNKWQNCNDKMETFSLCCKDTLWFHPVLKQTATPLQSLHFRITENGNNSYNPTKICLLGCDTVKTGSCLLTLGGICFLDLHVSRMSSE